jgi:hypothetical protein
MGGGRWLECRQIIINFYFYDKTDDKQKNESAANIDSLRRLISAHSAAVDFFDNICE